MEYARSPLTAGFLVALSGLWINDTLPAAAAPRCPSSVQDDVNGDGRADLAVGLTPKDDFRGAVQVFYGQPRGLALDANGSAPDDQYFTLDTAGIPGAADPGDRFGATTTFGDFNDDGCADLAISAPGDNGVGSVTVLFGSRSGLSTSGVRRLVPSAYLGSFEGANFGQVAAADLDDDGVDDLVIGADDLTVKGLEQAGGIVIVYGSAAGLDRGSKVALITQNTPGIAGPVRAEAGFGSVLEPGDFDGDVDTDLAVGLPNAGGEPGTGPGAVQVLVSGPNGITGGEMITARTPGVPGGLRTDDFGEVLAAGDVDADGDDDLAVSAPETSTGGWDTGVVYVFPGSASGLTATGSQLWSEDTPGVPGAIVDSSAFGASLAMGRLDAGPTDDLVIGAPYATPGAVRLAGTATVLFGSRRGLTASGAQWWHQDVPEVPGTAESSDTFGSAVATPYLGGPGAQATLLVGAPSETVAGNLAAGLLLELSVGPSGPVATGSRHIHAGTPGVRGSLEIQSGFASSLNGPDGLG